MTEQPHVRSTVHPRVMSVRRVSPTVTVIDAGGELTDATLLGLRDELLFAVDGGARQIVVDIRADIERIDPSGLDLLLTMGDLVAGRGGSLWIRSEGADAGTAWVMRIDASGVSVATEEELVEAGSAVERKR
jgi:anti-anti-sigma regulatory factor